MGTKNKNPPDGAHDFGIENGRLKILTAAIYCGDRVVWMWQALAKLLFSAFEGLGFKHSTVQFLKRSSISGTPQDKTVRDGG